MKSTTELNITVSVLNNEVEQDIILLKKVKVKDLRITSDLIWMLLPISLQPASIIKWILR